MKEAVARAEAAEKKAYEGHLDSQDKLEMYQVGKRFRYLYWSREVVSNQMLERPDRKRNQ